MVKTGTARSDIDLFEDSSLLDPYPDYQALRDLGGVVWLERYDVWAVPRYDTALSVLRNHDVFSSQLQGVAFTPMPPEAVRSTLTSDLPAHRQLRGVVADQLRPSSLRALEDRIAAEAEALITGLVTKGEFDAVTDLAQHLPLAIVTDLVGVPQEVGERLLEYSDARGDSFGPPQCARTKAGFERLAAIADMVAFLSKPEHLRPGSMGRCIFEAAERGEITAEQAPVLMRDYLGPSLDTTINGTASLLLLLATNPGQWEMLRANPELAPNAVNEAVRLESPIQFFCRTAKVDAMIDGVGIAANDRVLVMFGSANRDERKWADAHLMNIERAGLSGHVGFGAGIHTCAGRSLAQMEMVALCRQLALQCRDIQVISVVRNLNNVLRGLKSLQLRVC